MVNKTIKILAYRLQFVLFYWPLFKALYLIWNSPYLRDCEVTDSVQYEQAATSVKHYSNIFIDYLFFFSESKGKSTGAYVCVEGSSRRGIYRHLTEPHRHSYIEFTICIRFNSTLYERRFHVLIWIDATNKSDKLFLFQSDIDILLPT